ncbi:aldehyde dehydrogenase family protein [Nocardioides sp. AE5]|uniref:aldehyde dehydrogenase family protein n=1 Tax=Nocardioides sp. AE5 TaxID=2962573 RepID=UPI00288256AD|nr:aldehyde dehydrogenase family protein [Nocardioides sp. AE5]MDT0202481.1 aldehyde dehydrogenase family protein [Nocardioides sp. AE5]
MTASLATPAEVRRWIGAKEWGMIVNGHCVSARSEKSYQTDDPATGLLSARVPDGDSDDVASAVQAGLDAYPGWAALGFESRAAVIRGMVDLLETHRNELAALDSVDSGNPLAASQLDIDLSIRSLHMQAAEALALRGTSLVRGEGMHYTAHEPYGVVGRIVAYNHPLLYAVARVAPALLAGNAIVLKPAPQTPLSALRWAELAQSLLPSGVFNVVTGATSDVGEALVAHPDVKRLSFIGSAQVGRSIQEGAARSGVKNVSLELGGKNAILVFPDSDLDEAANAAYRGMNFDSTGGQSCGSTSRVLVHSSMKEPFTWRLADLMAGLQLGDPLEPDTMMGPMISAAHQARVQSWVQRGLADGARLEFENAGATPAHGYFVPPVILGAVRGDMSVAQEEIFGPVVTVMEFEDEDEAVALANNTRYGLTASVWTKDLRRAHRVAGRLQAGYVWVNDVARHYPGLPFGGMKDSGVGREESAEELLSYTETKSVHVSF